MATTGNHNGAIVFRTQHNNEQEIGISEYNSQALSFWLVLLVFR